jgi:hypothetical protein
MTTARSIGHVATFDLALTRHSAGQVVTKLP